MDTHDLEMLYQQSNKKEAIYSLKTFQKEEVKHQVQEPSPSFLSYLQNKIKAEEEKQKQIQMEDVCKEMRDPFQLICGNSYNGSASVILNNTNSFKMEETGSLNQATFSKCKWLYESANQPPKNPQTASRIITGQKLRQKAEEKKLAINKKDEIRSEVMEMLSNVHPRKDSAFSLKTAKPYKEKVEQDISNHSNPFHCNGSSILAQAQTDFSIERQLQSTKKLQP